MDKRIEMLQEWGCDIKDAMERMMDDEDFYIECLEDIPPDPNFLRLTEALNNKNIEEAFNSAHTLKGVLINLALTPMYNKVVEIVEPLRTGFCKGLIEKNEELLAMREKLAAILVVK